MDTAVLVPLLVAASLIAAGILVSPLSRRIGMPVLLLFLAVGMLAGEDGPGNIQFDDVGIAFVVSNLALAVILLDGGMRTRVESFRVGLKPAMVLASFGVVLTAGVTGIVAAWLLGQPLLYGLLIGAIVSSTDAAVVFSLLQGRDLSLNERLKATLEIESGSNDPMAIFLTLLFIALLLQPESGVGSGLLLLLRQFGLGAVAGYVGGRAMTWLLRVVVLVDAMYPLLVVAGALVLFSLTSLAGGSGFLAVYLMGVGLARHRTPHQDGILQIHDGLAWLAQLILFLLLGLLVTPSQLLGTLPQALAIAAVVTFLARPLAALLCLFPFGFSPREQAFMAWAGLRGAVPVVLAIFPLIAGVPEARSIFQITFVIVLVSLLLQGSTLAPLARLLRLEVPPRPDPAQRVPLQAPGSGAHELLLFPLHGKRWSTPVEITEIHLPENARVVMCFRDGVMHERRKGCLVKEGDVIAVLAAAGQALDIGQILGWEEPPDRLTDRRFFGEFTVNGAALLRDVQAMYGFTVTRFDPSLTLAACFAQASGGHPVLGDRLDLGSVLLVAREVAGDQVVKVGLKLSRI